jgi:4'-phosphopantetheinyl transferase
VRVFAARLDADGEPLDEAAALLSSDERERARRFRFDVHRDAFLRARAFLRRTLAAELGRDPRSLAFREGPWGKPCLANAPRLEFNLSHSGAIALCALAPMPVGVDVEQHREGVESLEIAELYFTENELATLRTLPPPERVLGFFLCWTRKEAYVKARGEGLTVPLSSFDVTCAPGAPARLTGLGDAAPEVARWSVANLDVAPGYSAAVCALGSGWDATLIGGAARAPAWAPLPA